MRAKCVLIAFGIFILTLTSCNNSKVDKSQFTTSINVYESCEFGERKNTKKVKEMVVKVVREESNIIFLTERYRYVACNIDESSLPINDSIIISGNEKEMYPYEFWLGQPIKLTSAYKKPQPQY